MYIGITLNRKVVIVEKQSGRIVTTDEINLTAVNYDPTEKEWFDIAWKNAIQDKLVKEEDKHNYEIKFG